MNDDALSYAKVELDAANRSKSQGAAQTHALISLAASAVAIAEALQRIEENARSKITYYGRQTTDRE